MARVDAEVDMMDGKTTGGDERIFLVIMLTTGATHATPNTRRMEIREVPPGLDVKTVASQLQSGLGWAPAWKDYNQVVPLGAIGPNEQRWEAIPGYLTWKLDDLRFSEDALAETDRWPADHPDGPIWQDLGQ